MFRWLLFSLFFVYCTSSKSRTCVKDGLCPFVHPWALSRSQPCFRFCPNKNNCPLKNTCQKDEDCPDEKKCCLELRRNVKRRGRNYYCKLKKCLGKKELFYETEKPGFCPRFRQISSICDKRTCRDDGHCKGDQKCCRNRCGSQFCVDPVHVPVPLQCPCREPFTLFCKQKNMCATMKCPRKCCWDGCENFCI